MSHTFCPIPWKHLSTQANGDLRVCCQCVEAPYGKARKSDGTFYNAQKDGMDEVRNAEIFKEIRRDMLAGKKSAHCNLCWHEEALGKSSRRQDELKLEDGKLEEEAGTFTLPDGTIDTNRFPVRHFDLRLGNHCNLKCRSCSPRDSSSWYDDYAKITLEDSFFRMTPPKIDGRYKFRRKEKGWTLDTKDFEWHENSALLKSIEENMDNVDRIYFTGGEPTLIKAHWKLLEKFIERGHAQHIWLDYNTNVSGVTDEWLGIWSKFKHVFLGCSIDGIGEKATYLRPPVEWNVIEKNLEKIARAEGNIHAAFCITVSAYNVLHYPEMLEYLWSKNWKNFDVVPFGQVLEHPSWMSVQLLPQKIKQQVAEKYADFYDNRTKHLHPVKRGMIKEKLDYILNFMNEKDMSGEIKSFLRKTDQLDRIRNQSFKNVFPELSSQILK